MNRVSEDDIAKFQFHSLGPYRQIQSQSLQISMDRLCIVTARLQSQTHKIQSNIFKKRTSFLKLLRS